MYFRATIESVPLFGHPASLFRQNLSAFPSETNLSKSQKGENREFSKVFYTPSNLVRHNVGRVFNCCVRAVNGNGSRQQKLVGSYR